MDTPIILQKNKYECGLAALAMLFSYKDKKIDISFLKKDKQEIIGRDGLSLADLKKIAKDNAGNLRVFKVYDITKYLDTYEITQPLLCYINNSHYIVVTCKKKDRIWVNDPQVGRYNISEQEFSNLFSGYIAILEKNKKNKDIFEFSSKKNARLFSYITTHSSVVIQLIFWTLVFQVLNILFPAMIQKIIDQEINITIFSLFMILGLSIVYYLISKYQLKLATKLQIIINKLLTIDFVKKVFSIKSSFIETNSIGYFTNSLSNINAIKEILVSLSTLIVINVTLMLIYTIALIYFSPILTLIVYGFVIMQGIVLWKAAPKIRDFIGGEIKNNIDFQNYYIESLKNYNNIKSMGDPKYVVNFILDKFTGQLHSFEKRMDIQIKLTSFLGTVQWLLPFIVLIAGYLLMDSINLTMGSLVAISAIALRIVTPLASASEVYQSILMMKEIFENIDNVLTQPEENADKGNSIDTMPFPIKFNDIGFSYGNTEIFKNITLNIEKNDKIIIKGKSGEGKTTLLKLLTTLYAPTVGKIYFGGKELKNYKLNHIRSKIGYMSQDYSLISGTIMDNITMFDDRISLKDVEKAAQLVCIDEFINQMPMNYYTFLNSNGSSLSGGQIQRICLARAIVRNPELLVIDEGTSNLDKDLERKVIRNLFNLNCCICIVSHRHNEIDGINKEIVINNNSLLIRKYNKGDIN